jgi:long-chain acyl-CoA synthetase
MDNFCARILDAARRFPDRPAIEKARVGAVETTTYRSLIDDAGRFAAWLSRAGLAPGDRAAILADNDASWIAAYLGTLWMGGVAVPLDTAYKAPQVRTIIEHSGARVLFTIPRYLDIARAAVDPLGAAAPSLVLLTGSSPGVADIMSVRTSDDPAPPVFASFDVRTSNVELPQGSSVILYTSGTTADPKGVVLSHANLDAERLAAFAVVDVTEHDAVLGVLPLFHALAQMANLLLPLSVGARVVFLETVNSSTLLEALQTRDITIFACVPQFFYLIHQRVTAEVARGGSVARVAFRALLATNGWLRDTVRWNPGHTWFGRVHRQLGPKMRLLITGGSKFDPAIGRDLHALGFTLLNAYGLTETSGGATMMRPRDKYTTSVGHPFPGVEIKIDSGSRFPPDQPKETGFEGKRLPESILDGEILIRGPIVMREYFRRPDATSEALDAGGWLHTGDLGRLDADGRLYITGRLKEIIVLSSGKNLYPEEIEAHYRQSTVIKELCVLGFARPDEPAAERLHAVIVPDEEALRARGVVNIGDLIRFEVETASASLPAHKRILSYDISLEPLPRTTTGKLRRHEILRAVHERAASKTADVTRPLSDAERQWLETPAHQAAIDVVAVQLARRDLRPDANLDLDLGLDSLERVELLTTLERRAGTKVPSEVRATIFTLRQLIDAVITGAPGDPAALPGGDPRSELPWAAILAEPADAVLEADLRRSKLFVALGCFLVLRVAALAARLMLGFRVEGRPQLPQDRPFIICPNHQSHLDGLFLAAALPFRSLRRLFFVGAAEYFQTPMMKRLARLINIVPVDPDANLVTAMQAGATGLHMNKILILFPEGERTIDGELKRFRKGAAILASHVGAPIVPVAIDGLFPLWPRGRGFQWRALAPGRSKRVSVRFGEAIDVKPGEYSEGTERLRASVSGLLS